VKCRFFLALAIAGVIGLAIRVKAADDPFPLSVSPTGRYLIDRQNRPFLVVGDSPWSLIVQPSPADIDHYLDDRKARGFTAILINLVEHKFCTHPPMTRSGLAPFKKAGDFATTNDAYFDYAAGVVKKAHDRGIVVWLCPAYLGSKGGDEGWFQELKSSGPKVVRNYGRYVGHKFRSLPNIVWVLGGDFTPPTDSLWTIDEVAEGIREADKNHLMTGHPGPGPSAASAFPNRAWLEVNATYSYDPNLHVPLLKDYTRRPVRPFVLLESVYENEHESTPDQIRRQAYWAMLSGACGQFLGNCPIWHFDGPGLFKPKMTWKKALGDQGSKDMERLRAAFISRKWHLLIPDKEETVVVDGDDGKLNHATTAMTPDRRLSLTYLPSTGTATRTVKVDRSRITGPVTAKWYNPTTGNYLRIALGQTPDKSTWQTPGDNGTKTNDWLLVIESDAN
jgi:hypothetical protein